MTGLSALAALLAGAGCALYVRGDGLDRVRGIEATTGRRGSSRSSPRPGPRGPAARRERARNAQAVPLVCRTLAGELRAGAPPGHALAAAAEAAPAGLHAALGRAARAADVGGDPADALRSGVAGGEGLWLLAACWDVTTDLGSGLAAACEHVAMACEADLRARREVAAALAGPRASAAVLAALPAVGLVLAAGLGADPVGFLASPGGVGCLVGGVGLDTLGLVWTRRLAAGALR